MVWSPSAFSVSLLPASPVTTCVVSTAPSTRTRHTVLSAPALPTLWNSLSWFPFHFLRPSSVHPLEAPCLPLLTSLSALTKLAVFSLPLSLSPKRLSASRKLGHTGDGLGCSTPTDCSQDPSPAPSAGGGGGARRDKDDIAIQQMNCLRFEGSGENQQGDGKG